MDYSKYISDGIVESKEIPCVFNRIPVAFFHPMLIRQIAVLPLTVVTEDGKEYRDGVDITPAEFYRIKLKPIVSFSAEGEFHVLKKVLGGKRAMREMTELVMSHSVCTDYPVIPLFAQSNENCLFYMENLKNAGFSDRMQEPQGIGATIGTYIGPGGYGITFVGK